MVPALIGAGEGGGGGGAGNGDVMVTEVACHQVLCFGQLAWVPQVLWVALVSRVTLPV